MLRLPIDKVTTAKNNNTGLYLLSGLVLLHIISHIIVFQHSQHNGNALSYGITGADIILSVIAAILFKGWNKVAAIFYLIWKSGDLYDDIFAIPYVIGVNDIAVPLAGALITLSIAAAQKVKEHYQYVIPILFCCFIDIVVRNEILAEPVYNTVPYSYTQIYLIGCALNVLILSLAMLNESKGIFRIAIELLIAISVIQLFKDILKITPERINTIDITVFSIVLMLCVESYRKLRKTG